MNWQAISFDWNQVRAFLATAEAGSFSAGARALGTTQPTVGRQIAGLEAKLGVTLFERSGRGLRLTQVGRDLLEHVRAMGDAAALVSMAADSQSQVLIGQVTITATDLLSAKVLPTLLAPARQAAPGIRIHIVASSDLRNLMQREADIAIRHVRPDQPDLIARHVGDFRANLYAARGYLDRAGRPRSLHEIADHAFVGNADPERLLAPLQSLGVPVSAENFTVSSDSGVVAFELTNAGYGLSMQPERLAEEAGLEKVSPDLPSLRFPIWLVTHRELHTSQRIRFIFDQLAAGIRHAVH